MTQRIVIALVMGFGMCCTMVWSNTLFVLGIIIGVAGIIGICTAYPPTRVTNPASYQKRARIIRVWKRVM